MDIKVIHTSDLHLGSTFKVLGDKSKLHRIDCQDVFTNIINLCINEKVKALLIGGDLFDTAEPQKSLVKFVISEFERLNKEKITVFISSGNHDPYKSGSVWLAYRFPSNVIIFDSSDLEAKEIDGLTVYGLAYINDTKERTVMSDLLSGDTNIPLILDDPFHNFDNVRLAKTMSMINEIAKNKQIILISHRPYHQEFKNFAGKIIELN